MKVSDLGKQLYDLVLENSHDFSPHYNKVEKEFLDRYNQFSGTKNDLRIDLSQRDDYSSVLLSTLLADFTSVFPYHKESFLYTFDPKIQGRKIIGPQAYLKKISEEIHGSTLYTGYGCVSEEKIEKIFEDFYPLIEANRVLIRPEKIVIVADLNEKTGNGRAAVHPADPNGEANEWRVIKESTEHMSYVLLDKNSKIKNHKTLSEILIPYIKGISINEFSKVLLEEEDLLSSFRMQTKTYLDIIQKNEANVEEFRMDVIQPKVDLISRKFKTITNNHRLKIAGATAGTAGLMILSMNQAELTAALSQFISFGLGTVGFVKSEAEYQENVDKLRDVPEYLLWKINKR